MRNSNKRTGHVFSEIPRADIQRSLLDRGHGIKTTLDSGWLVPVLADEALPGDTITCRPQLIGRMATPLVPIMDNLHLDTFFFAVPYRLLWENWERFCGSQDDPGDSTDFLIPQIDSGIGYGSQSISDYIGLPTGQANLETSALWHRAYNLIFKEWFRDENLQDSPVIHKDDATVDGLADYPLRRRGKRKDYFSSALPFAQKGPSVTLPLGSSAPLTMDADQFPYGIGDHSPRFDYDNRTGEILKVESSTGNVIANAVPNATASLNWAATGSNPSALTVEGLEGTVDLAAATAASINSIRQAFQIQKLYERDARGGTRMVELLQSHFGVTSPDFRLQRPEFLGGGSTPINVQSVAQTSNSDSQDTPQGNLAAFATFDSSSGAWTKSFVEHSIILGLVSIRADLSYQQGTPRQFSRKTRWDFYWPTLAHLGEQAILNKEIYTDVSGGTDDDVFGYQERWAEYRYKPSLITGKMRSQAGGSVDIWHLAQDFADLPVLGDTFIQDTPPVSRVVAVPSEPEFILDGWFRYSCARPMPTYSVPGLIDHF